ncbi:MAG: DUF5995 family protein [Acidobacteriota bacterium]
MALLRRFGGRLGDAIIRFSLTVARQGAWRLAERLAPRPAGDWPPIIDRRDVNTVKVGRDVLGPGRLLEALVLVIRCFESGDIRRNIQVLVDVPMPSFERVEARRRARATPSAGPGESPGAGSLVR